MSDTFAIVLTAGGQGARMKAGRPKQFLELFGRPVLYWSLANLAPLVGHGLAELVITHPAGEKKELHQLLRAFPAGHPFCPSSHSPRLQLVEGGTSRQQSVANGLAALDSARSSHVFIHDAARPFASADLFLRLLNLLQQSDAAGAVPLLPVVDTVKGLDEQREFVLSTVDRSRLALVQTPQLFPMKLIRDLHLRAAMEGLDLTDDCGLVEHYLRQRVLACDGLRWNLKLTHPEDLRLMQVLVEAGLVELPDTSWEPVS